MNQQQPQMAPYARIAVKLLQGAVSDDQEDLWQELVQYEVELTGFFEQIAVSLIIDKRDGYAYLKQMELEEDKTIGLVRRTPLTYEMTLVCVLLREWIQEFETNDLETKNLYITPKQFRERLEIFFKERTNELKFIRELNKYLADCEKFGFVKLVHKDALYEDENRYEVKRIIKARITNDELDKFKKLLEDDIQPV